MSIYVGAECPVCKEKFTNQDDVVVCPVCGTPHHRSCYAQKNECAFVLEHATGIEWKPPVPPEQPSEIKTVLCKRCGGENAVDALNCKTCGFDMQGGSAMENSVIGQFFGAEKPMNNLDQQRFIYGGVNPEDEILGVPVKDMAIYIGPSSAYFIPRFKVMEKQKTFTSINFPAILFGFFYYFYRKMYLLGAVLLLVFILSLIPFFLYSKAIMPDIIATYPQLSQMLTNVGIKVTAQTDYLAASYYSKMNDIIGTVYFVACAAVSVFFNKAYLNKMLDNIKQTQSAFKDKNSQIHYNAELMRQGGVSTTATIISGVALAVIWSMVSYYIMQAITTII